MNNIEYKTSKIKQFYKSNRLTWEEFYLSERKVINKVVKKLGSDISILDVGCAAGGLGYALNEKFGITQYTGIDINEAVIEYANSQSYPDKCNFNFIHGDIVIDRIMARNQLFDAVISLGCVDWNVNLLESIKACWRKVKPGGFLIVSMRLTKDSGIDDIQKSYQHIEFTESSTKNEQEKANYVVVNILESINLLKALNPHKIHAYGYWGKPSTKAVTPYTKLLFTVFGVKKSNSAKSSDPKLNLNLPASAFCNQ